MWPEVPEVGHERSAASGKAPGRPAAGGRPLTPLEGGLLGLLARGGELSGWDLQKQAQTSIAYFWPFGRSQMYAALPRLERAGMTEGRAVPQEGRPDKRLFRLTERGRIALADWLRDKAAAPVQDLFLLKIFFAAHVDRSAVRAHLEERRAMAAGLADEIGQMADSPDIDDFFHRLTRDYGMAWGRFVTAWCDEALSALDALDHDRSTS
jgi:PadR family transcriptional regulator AphA